MRRVNNKLYIVDVTGYVFWVFEDNQQPVLMELDNNQFLPVFTTPEKAAVMREKVAESLRLKQITDHHEFCDSVAGKVRVVVDPVEDKVANKTRWLELYLTDEPLPEPTPEE
jgi:hypothetical protein